MELGALVAHRLGPLGLLKNKAQKSGLTLELLLYSRLVNDFLKRDSLFRMLWEHVVYCQDPRLFRPLELILTHLTGLFFHFHLVSSTTNPTINIIAHTLSTSVQKVSSRLGHTFTLPLTNYQSHPFVK